MTTVRVSPGEGCLCRRDDAVLFIASQDAGALVTAFTASEDLFDSVTTHLVAVDFSEAPFALIEWHDRIRVTVFGDLEVRTDHPALPMLSGASSSTWVEHTLPSGVTELTLTIGAQPVIAWSDLGLGIVTAGGLELTLGETSERLMATTPSTPAAAPEPVKPTEAKSAIAAPQPEEPDVALPAGQGSRPDLFVEPSPFTPESAEPLPSRSQSAAAPETEDDSPQLEQETGEAIASASSHRTAPLLRFDDGDVLELTERMVVGRNPASDVANMLVSGDRISREHLALHCEDDKVFVTDLASTNGTYIVLPDETEPIRLPEDIPFLLDAGATVRFGSRSMTLELMQG